MIETLISSRTRIKLLLKFFLNSNNTAYLRNLEDEFQESTNSIRIELNRFEEAGLISSNFSGNKKIFKVNTKHSLYDELHSIVKKYFGIDRIVEEVVVKLGDVSMAFLAGSLAKGLDDENIDLILVGNINEEYLNRLKEKIKIEVKRNIRTKVYKTIEDIDKSELDLSKCFLLWSR